MKPLDLGRLSFIPNFYRMAHCHVPTMRPHAPLKSRQRTSPAPIMSAMPPISGPHRRYMPPRSAYDAHTLRNHASIIPPMYAYRPWNHLRHDVTVGMSLIRPRTFYRTILWNHWPIWRRLSWIPICHIIVRILTMKRIVIRSTISLRCRNKGATPEILWMRRSVTSTWQI